MQLSLPTKKQVLRSIELVIVVFLAAAGWNWTHNVNPFSKAALLAAGAAGVAAVYAIVKSFFTTV